MRIKEDILACTAAELNYGLAQFVKEITRPNGERYEPDSIYYLCLGIQQVRQSYCHLPTLPICHQARVAQPVSSGQQVKDGALPSTSFPTGWWTSVARQSPPEQGKLGGVCTA